ncbi:hypothetical protein ACO0OE_003534 [Hanseniaspora uvarum]
MNYQITLKPQVLKIIPQVITHTKSDKIYAFDMDGTLIQTKGRSRFAVSADDWKWFKPKKTSDNQHETMFSLILSILKKDPQSKIIIFSNQGGIRPMNFGVNASYNSTKTENLESQKHLDKKLLVIIDKVMKLLKSFYEELAEERVFFYCSFKNPLPKNEKERKLYASNKPNKKVFSFDKILKKKLNEPKVAEESNYFHDIQDCQVKYKNHKLFINQFNSLDEYKLNNILKFDTYRKPSTGMLEEFYNDIEDEANIEYFVGDAAGRKNDFSDSDKVFAENGKLKFYTPEELFSLHLID